MIVSTKNTKSIKTWNQSIDIGTDNFKLRLKDETYYLAKGSGNGSMKRIWEVVAPDIKSVDGNDIVMGGTEVVQYRSVRVVVGSDKTKLSLEQLNSNAISDFCDEFTKLNVELPEEIDNENPPKLPQGITVDALVRTQSQPMFTKITPEQAALGQRVGAPVKDSQGRPINRYQLSIQEILGLAV